MAGGRPSARQAPAVASPTTIGLFEADPDIAGFVPEGDQAIAARVRLPLLGLEVGEFDIEQALGSAGAFAALALDGMLQQSMQLGTQLAVRLLGPGEVVMLPNRDFERPGLAMRIRATEPTRLTLLGDEYLRAMDRWPALATDLGARAARRYHSMLAQLLICQLPRVEERLLEMMWLLAETWGRMTSSGTLLPLTLTHSTLGAMVGAARPTVTLALRDLIERGALVHEQDGWLLLEPSKVTAQTIVRPRGEPISDARLVEPSVREG